MEELINSIRQLDGALNAQIELTKRIDYRLTLLEQKNQGLVIENKNLGIPTTEQDLVDIGKLPDRVKELQVFDGNPVQYLSWIHNVETILEDYKIIRDKPLYRSILQSIRGRIRGSADAALISYNIFDEDWNAIKKCLSLHYADKRDIRTLEHQLNLLSQKNQTIDEFYANVNHQFSLIINKIKTEDYSQETVQVLVETYRNRALDVFIRGINGDISRMLMIQKPNTLPEAYTSCLEMQNMNYRSLTIHKKDVKPPIPVPINQFSNKPPINQNPPRNVYLPVQQRNLAYNIQHQRHIQNQPRFYPNPPRPSYPKPPIPMEVDRSIQTKQVNYMNRPNNYNHNNYNNNPNKNYSNKYHNEQGKPKPMKQAMYHVETYNENNPYRQKDLYDVYDDLFPIDNDDEDVYENSNSQYNHEEDQVDSIEESPEQEVNFMINASPAYHI